MRPTNRLFLLALIIFLLFGTAPTVLAVEPTTEDFDNASFATCDDPPISHYGEITSPAQVLPQVDYYAVDLVAGQSFTIDVDAEKIGSPLGSILEVFDAAGNLVAVSVESSNVPAAEPARSAPGMDISPDPYLEMAVDVDRTYYLAISAETPGAGADTGSYILLLKCSGQPPPPPEFKWPVEVGDLLGATGSNPGSLINITPETAESTLPFDLGVGPIIDIEFDPSRELVFAAVDTVVAIDDAVAVDAAITVEYIPARIVALNPNSGNEVESYSLETELVVALEAAEKELYGIQVDPSSEKYSLVLVTFDDSDLTATLTHVVSFGKKQARALAYHQSEKVMYAASGTDLLKIDLASSPVEILEVVVKLTDLSFVIASIDFSHEDVLYVIDVQGNLYELTDLTTGEARLINPISVTGEVSGLTFVIGEPPGVDPIKTICSSTLTTSASASSETAASKLSRFKRKRNRLRRAIGLYKFEGIEGETVTINAVLEQQESAEAAVEESSVITLKNTWLNWRGKGRVFLGIRDSIPDVDFRARKKDQLPLTMSATLPANGTYYVMLIRPLLRFYKTDYCLTLESDYEESQAWKTFDVAWPNDESEDNTASTSAEEQ